MATIKQTVGLNSHKELDNLPANWNYKNYHHPMEWMNNVRWFFSMEDIYTEGSVRKTPQTFDPALECIANQSCPTQPCDPQKGWNGLENAKVRYFCDDSKYPTHFNTQLFALARIQDTQGNIRQFINKHWDVTEWSSCWDSNNLSNACLDEIKDHGKELAQVLNTHFSSRVTHVHLNEFWDPNRKVEYHKFQEGLHEDAQNFSVISNSMQASDPGIGNNLYDNYMNDYIQSTDEAICIHPYSFTTGAQHTGGGNFLNGIPEEMYWGAQAGKHTEIADLIQWRDNNYPNKPIWITEIGWNSTTQGMSLEIQSNYTMRALLLAMAYNVEKVFFYWLRDTPDGSFGTTGWLYNNYNPKPVYVAMEELMSKYKDFEFDKWLLPPGGNHVVMQLKGPNNAAVRIEWNVDNSVNGTVSGKPLFTPVDDDIINPPQPPPPPPGSRTFNLNQCVPNFQSGGIWSYGVVGTSPSLPLGMSLNGSNLTIANNAETGYFAFNYSLEKNDNNPKMSVCQTIHIKVGD